MNKLLNLVFFVKMKIESAIHCVSGGAVIKGLEAVAVACLMLFVESLQLNIKAAMKLDEGSHSRLTTLTEIVSTAQFLLSCIPTVLFNHPWQCSMLNILF